VSAPFALAEGAAPLQIEPIERADGGWKVLHDLAKGTVSVEIGEGPGTYRIVENDLTITSVGSECYSFRTNEHGSAKAEAKWTFDMSRDDWTMHSITETVMTSTPSHFHIEARLAAWEGDALVHEQTWTETISRQLV
jgi:hypothetical protein